MTGGQRCPGERCAVAEELILEGRVAGGRVGRAGLLMVEVAGGDGGGGVVADGEPGLGDRGEREVVGGAGAAHLGGNPAGLNRVGEHARPVPGDGEGQDRVVELAVGVGLGAVPPSPLPLRVGQVGVTASVHAGAEVDQAGGRGHQGGE